MQQKISTVVGTLIIIIMALTAGAFVLKIDKFDMENLYQPIINPAKSKKTAPIACTMEAKLCADGTYVSRSGPNCEFAACLGSGDLKDKIIIYSPKIGEEIFSPFSVSGQARGDWFFEGSFQIEIYDSNDKLLGSSFTEFVPKNANDTWMTNNLVDFKGGIKFSQPGTESGYILFKKDNPSGNPEMGESFKQLINFAPKINTANWQTYRTATNGFEIKYPDRWVVEKDEYGLGGESEIISFKEEKDIEVYIRMDVFDNETAGRIACIGDCSFDLTKYEAFKNEQYFIEINLMDDDKRSEDEKKYMQKIFGGMSETFKFVK